MEWWDRVRNFAKLLTGFMLTAQKLCISDSLCLACIGKADDHPRYLWPCLTSGTQERHIRVTHLKRASDHENLNSSKYRVFRVTLRNWCNNQDRNAAAQKWAVSSEGLRALPIVALFCLLYNENPASFSCTKIFDYIITSDDWNCHHSKWKNCLNLKFLLILASFT